MRITKLLITICLLSIVSCNQNQKELEQLKEQNEKLKQELSKRNQQVSKTYYVVGKLKISSPGSANEYKTKYYNWREQTIITQIKEFKNYNQEIEYRFLDQIEQNFRNTIVPNWPVKILEKKSFVYDSYAKASEARRNLNNQQL